MQQLILVRVVVDCHFRSGGDIPQRVQVAIPFPVPERCAGFAGVVKEAQGVVFSGFDVPSGTELQAHPCPLRGLRSLEPGDEFSGGEVAGGEDA
jgi:hypothetical protein